jgi:hypothetical protein
LREQDIPALAKAACREADINYPVPRAMSQQDCEALLREVLPPVARKVAARKPAVRKAPARKPAVRKAPARRTPRAAAGAAA